MDVYLDAWKSGMFMVVSGGPLHCCEPPCLAFRVSYGESSAQSSVRGCRWCSFLLHPVSVCTTKTGCLKQRALCGIDEAQWGDDSVGAQAARRQTTWFSLCFLAVLGLHCLSFSMENDKYTPHKAVLRIQVTAWKQGFS